MTTSARYRCLFTCRRQRPSRPACFLASTVHPSLREISFRVRQNRYEATQSPFRARPSVDVPLATCTAHTIPCVSSRHGGRGIQELTQQRLTRLCGYTVFPARLPTDPIREWLASTKHSTHQMLRMSSLYFISSMTNDTVGSLRMSLSMTTLNINTVVDTAHAAATTTSACNS